MKNNTNKDEITIEFPNNSLLAIIVGNYSVNISKLEKLIDVDLNLFGNQFIIAGEFKKINLAKTILTNIYNKLSNEKINNLNFDFSFFET